jgi:hypothetical protein
MKTTYVLGAGASKDAGYPLARSMGSDLFAWMEKHEPNENFHTAATALREMFGSSDDIENLLTRIDEFLSRVTADQWQERERLGNQYKPALIEALRQWFIEIRQRPADSYEQFAQGIVQDGDSIISFNYDVALDRQLKRAGLWKLGDGYGFEVEGFETGSQVDLLKLHGSINWLASLFGGVISGPFAIQRGRAMGDRPVFSDLETCFLGYENMADSKFPRAGTAALVPLILPTACKKFYFETNLGRQWEGFWNSLWNRAANVLAESKRIVICGYSLLAVDKRACELLLTNKSTSCRIDVCCGNDSEDIVRRLQVAGHNAQAAGQPYFGDWIKHQISNQA